MNDFEGRYYNHTKRCLTLLGLWFDQSAYKTQFCHLVWYIINLSLIIPMVIMLLNEYKNMTILLENVVHIMFFTAGSIKFSITVFSLAKMKALYSKIASDWQDIKNKTERIILKRYNKEGLWLSKLYMLFIVVTWIVCSLKPFVPRIVDLIIPLKNGSRPLLTPLKADYILFDQSDHIYLMSAYTAASYTFFLPFFSGFDSFYLLTVKHTCGLFAVICHRIQTALDILQTDIAMESSRNNRKQIGCRKNLIDAIILHNDTIRSVELLENSFNVCFLAIIVMATIGLAIASTFIIYAVDELISLFGLVLLKIAILFHLFCINWVGQQLIDSSEQIFYSAYFSDWYIMHPEIRKYILIIMLRSYTPSKLTAGKLLDLSMETFGMIIRKTVSYFTVFFSLM